MESIKRENYKHVQVINRIWKSLGYDRVASLDRNGHIVSATVNGLPVLGYQLLLAGKPHGLESLTRL